MSHFVVLVITKPDESVDDLLQPYHEYECTGIEDEFVVTVDATQEVKDAWEKEKAGRKVKGGGAMKNKTEYPNIIAFAKGYFGYENVGTVKEPKFTYRTNPNRKWDWWVIGGRLENFLYSKSRPGKTFDVLPKSDVTWEPHEKRAMENAAKRWDAAKALIAGRPYPRWADVVKQFEGRYDTPEFDKARADFNAHPVIREFNGHKFGEHQAFRWDDSPETFEVDRAVYIERCRLSASTTFALVDSAGWHERGKMGGWACVSDEMSDEDWAKAFAERVAAAPDDATFTIVDCHI